MKGVVFTEFLEMVEARFSADMVDDILDDAAPGSGGAYTAVGTYPHEEMSALLGALSRRAELGVPDLLRAFGKHLFGRFREGYPSVFVGADSALAFLAGIESVIHAEVRKLYPDAELPSFVVERHDDDHLVLLYASRRHLEDLAEGLIDGCVAYFGEEIRVDRQTLGEGEERRERFTLVRSRIA